MQRINNKTPLFISEAGFSLIELLVAIALCAIALGAITSLLITSMRAQQEVSADFRSQLDVRQVLYDMEKNIAEAKRKDDTGNQPIFQADALAIPTQQGNWVTFEYATKPGDPGPTIIRKYSDVRPSSLPTEVSAADKEMINVGESELLTTVNRGSPGAPIFTYFDVAGNQLSAPVTNPRNVKSIKVTFLVTVDDGHAQNEAAVSSTQIYLRNF